MRDLPYASVLSIAVLSAGERQSAPAVVSITTVARSEVAVIVAI
jgi:hypothetical protein